ncbi:MAG: hypothetical protein PVJ53_01935 [Desulfobacterales bacterium]|jgi:hypothetical protein
MDNWSHPQSINQWLKDASTLRTVVLVLLLALGLTSELRFDWVEHIIGRYLATTNQFRPESGAIWDKGHRTEDARQVLDKIVTDKQSVQREAREAKNFTQIAQTLSRGIELIISANHFRQIYNELPPELAAELMSPYALVRIISEKDWDRAFFEPGGSGFSIYFLNKDNRVLKQLTVSADMLARIDRGETTRTDTLDNLPQFAERIYPAERFFRALEAVSEDVRRQGVPWPENLLKTSGRVSRVAISDEVLSGYIEIGFELEEPRRTRVILVQGRDWAVTRIRSVLEGEAFESPITY